MAKHKYTTDTEAGIRTITQIRNLPAGQLTDEEFVKMFFDRLDAKALLMIYVDDKLQMQSFGRLRRGAMALGFYKDAMKRMDQIFGANSNIKELDELP